MFLLDCLASFQLALIWQGELNQYVTQDQSPKEKCELALDDEISEEGVYRISMLIDDEELELRELQEKTNLLIYSDNVAASRTIGYSLCPGNFGRKNYYVILCVMI